MLGTNPMTEQHYRSHDLKWIFHQIDEQNISVFVRFYDENIDFAYSLAQQLIVKASEIRKTITEVFEDLWKSPPVGGLIPKDPQSWLIFELRQRATKYLQMYPVNPTNFSAIPTTKWELDLQDHPEVFKALKASWNRFDKQTKRCMEFSCFYALPIYEMAENLQLRQKDVQKMIHDAFKQLRAPLGFNIRDESEDSEEMIFAELYGLGLLSGRNYRVFQKELSTNREIYEDRIREALEVLKYLYSYQPKIQAPSRIRENLLDKLGAETKTVPLPNNKKSDAGESPVKTKHRWPQKKDAPAIMQKEPKPNKTPEPLNTDTGRGTRRVSIFILFFILAWMGFQYAKPWLQSIQTKYKFSRLFSVEDKNESFLSLLGDRDSIHTTVYGLNPSPSAKGVLAWNAKKGKGYFFTSGLPVQDPSSYYKLWAFNENGPTFVDFVRLNEKGESLTKIDTLPPHFGFKKFGVSLEYHRNSFEKPNGNFYLIGDLE